MLHLSVNAYEIVWPCLYPLACVLNLVSPGRMCRMTGQASRKQTVPLLTCTRWQPAGEALAWNPPQPFGAIFPGQIRWAASVMQPAEAQGPTHGVHPGPRLHSGQGGKDEKLGQRVGRG